MPFELRPYPTPTLRPDGEYLQQAWLRSVYPLAERLGVEITLPSVSPQPYTTLAFEGLQFAREHGLANAYNDEVLKAFFVRSENIGDIDVLTRIAQSVGLDATQFRTALVEHRYAEVHKKLLKHAYEEANIRAVPTFIIGRRKVQGLYPAETLKQLIDEELANAPSQ
jgi:predicted DsbA family dithiol-disulfide isomerase